MPISSTTKAKESYSSMRTEQPKVGAKKIGGSVAKLMGKPELSAVQFDDLTTHGADVGTVVGDIKDQIALAHEGLSGAVK